MQNTLIIDDPLYDDEQSSLYLSLKNKKTMAVWRSLGRYPELTPTFVGKSVRYKKSVLQKFLDSRTRKFAPAKQRKAAAANA
jgi:hypothetical protein